MIAVRPGTDAWAVLEVVVKHPGARDAERIGADLWLPRVQSRDEYLQWRAANSVPDMNGLGKLSPATAARASKALGRLMEAALIEPMRPPLLEATCVVPEPRAARKRWVDATVGAIAPAAVEDEDEVVDEAVDHAAMAILLLRLVEKRPATVKAWLGSSPSGNVKRAARALYESGVVVSPSMRWPTQRGIDLLAARTVSTNPSVTIAPPDDEAQPWSRA